LKLASKPDRERWADYPFANRTEEEIDLLFDLAFDELDKPKAELAALRGRVENESEAA
jgi:hypothetical protein